MKPLSIYSLAAMLAWLLTCSAFTPQQPANAATRQVEYYFYSYPEDTFTDYNTVAGEISELEANLGVNVDTNSGGGTLVSRGYFNSNYPHNMLPSVLLYAHF
jgi:hypothetical protein